MELCGGSQALPLGDGNAGVVENVPTLMRLLSMMIRQPTERKPLLCILASPLFMAQHKHMALVQRAVSVMLYGNGTAKCVLRKREGSTFVESVRQHKGLSWSKYRM